MVLGVAAFTCLALIFTLLLCLVHQLRPKTFKVKAAITKWISVEVELESPQPQRLDEDTLTRRRRVLGEAYPSTRRSAESLAEDPRLLGQP